MMLQPAVVMDSQGQVREWTPLAETLFGYSAEAAVGRSLGDLIVPEAMRPYHEIGFRRYVQTREAHCVGFQVEIEAVHQDGRLVPIVLKIVPRESEGELLFEAQVAAGESTRVG